MGVNMKENTKIAKEDQIATSLVALTGFVCVASLRL